MFFFVTRGEVVVSQKVILYKEGGGGVPTPPLKKDITCEQPIRMWGVSVIKGAGLPRLVLLSDEERSAIRRFVQISAKAREPGQYQGTASVLQ